MEVITEQELANFEKVPPPKVARSNFVYSFNMLPKEERKAIQSLYAFCNYIDDIVDSTPTLTDYEKQHKLQRLAWWENVIENIYSGNFNHSILSPFVWAINRFEIPKQYFLILIDGIRYDVLKNRYATFEELKDYCFGVASIVGLISIEIFGYKYEETKSYAINLGYALQLTNIIRDIKSDKDRGYIYIPQEDLYRFGYSEEDLINEVYNDKFVELMRFQVRRAREFYHNARKLLHSDERITLVTAEIMDEIYYRLLEKIELNDFNIFKKKVKVSVVHKFLIALKHWVSITMFVKRIKKQP